MNRRHIRGETTVQVVLMVPVILLLLLVGVHVASYMHASNVANSAAKRGAQVAAGTSTFAEASSAATTTVNEMVRELGSRLHGTPQVSVSETFATVSVQVRIGRLLPFLPDTVLKRGIARREVFMMEGQR